MLIQNPYPIKTVIVILALVILSPLSTYAAACQDRGYTIIYVNGVFTDQNSAIDQKIDLKTIVPSEVNGEPVYVDLGYNESHLAGAGDLIESASQLLGSTITNYDRNTILLQIYPEVTTRKILLVGHSQGTFYTNEIYKYLTEHGEQKDSVGLYNIATPASFVAGIGSTQLPRQDSGQVTIKGAYLTSENDKVINSIRDFAAKIKAKPPLPANIDIPLTPQEAADRFGGHSFSRVYLANAAARIVSDVGDALKKLAATEVPNTAADSGCFIPPPRDFSYYAQQATFAVADPFATGAVATTKSIAAAGETVYHGAVTAGQIAYHGVAATAQSAVTMAGTAYTNIGKLFTNTLFPKTGNTVTDVARQSLAAVSNDFSNVNQSNNDSATASAVTDNNSENNSVSNNAQRENENLSQAASDPAGTIGNTSSIIPQGALASSEQNTFSSNTAAPNNTDSQFNNLKLGSIPVGASLYVSGGGGGGGGVSITANTSQNSSASTSANQTSTADVSHNPPSPTSTTNNSSTSQSNSPQRSSGQAGQASSLQASSSTQNSACGELCRTTSTSQSVSSSTVDTASSTIASSAASSTATTNSSTTNSSSSSSTASSSSTQLTASTATSSSAVSHILIGEILFNPVGNDQGKEFVELYNPGATQLNLAGWSLKQQKENSTSTPSLASFKTSSPAEDQAVIESKGFLLIGLNDYDSSNYGARSADIKRSGALPNGEKSGGQPEKIYIILSNGSSSEVDRIGYDKNSITSEGQSLERKTLQNETCLSSQNEREFLGNDCDTDHDGDFEIRNSPNPQNSASLPEPRSAPSIHNFQIMYNFAPRFDFSWDLSQDSTGATSTLSYSIYNTNSSSPTLIFEGSSATSTIPTATSYSIKEVGRKYDFEFRVQDRDGLIAKATSSIAARSFLDAFYFYRDFRTGSDSYLIDLTASSSRPFWLAMSLSNGNATDTSPNQSWKAVVLYSNTDAPKQEIISTSDFLIPSDPAFVYVKYSTCAGGESNEPELLLPSNSYSCQAGGLMSGAYLISRLEDQRFRVALASSTSQISFSPHDYLTLAFYDFGGGGGGSQRLQLAAVDTTKYYFQTAPAIQAAPTTPGNFSAVFDRASGKLNLGWSGSTDADTRDALIAYQINYSTSSVLSDSGWQSVGTVLSFSFIPTFPNSYKLGIRAIDDFGNISAPAVVDWSFPTGFVLLPSQLNHETIIGSTGGAGQKIVIGNAATINSAAFFVGPDGGPYNNSQSYIGIRKNSNGLPGDLIGTSTPKTIGQLSAPQELVYPFDSPLLLEAGSSYWLVPVQGPSQTTNGSTIYGSLADSYADGFWSASPGADAYFRLIQQ